MIYQKEQFPAEGTAPSLFISMEKYGTILEHNLSFGKGEMYYAWKHLGGDPL